jgi:hypothetical protein
MASEREVGRRSKPDGGRSPVNLLGNQRNQRGRTARGQGGPSRKPARLNWAGTETGEGRRRRMRRTATAGKIDRNQARVARARERKNLCSDTMLGISNLYYLGAKGHNI